MAHFLGKRKTTSTTTGESLAIVQFVAIVRGEWVVQAPSSPFRVEEVIENERYCLKCFGARSHDVVIGYKPWVPGSRCVVWICRSCGVMRSLDVD